MKTSKQQAEEDAVHLEAAAKLAAPMHHKRGFSSQATELFDAPGHHVGDLGRLQSAVEILIRIQGRYAWRLVPVDKRMSMMEKALLACGVALFAEAMLVLGIILYLIVGTFR